MTKIIFPLLFLIASSAYASYPSHPCKTRSTGASVDLYNSDDLYFAGRLLSRNGRAIEGIECLNRGKMIAPGYLDIRLELMNAFHTIGDKNSGLKEAEDLKRFKLTPYYQETWDIYLGKLNRIRNSAASIEGYEYIQVPVIDLGHDYKKIDDVEIYNEKALKLAVELKNEGKFSKAIEILEREILPFNRNSATVYMYAGIFYATVNEFSKSQDLFARSMSLIRNDVDVILLLMRAMNANHNPTGSIYLAKKKSFLFTDYGCLKLGMNLVDVYTKTNRQLAFEVQDYLTYAIVKQISEKVVCQEVKKYL